MNSKTRDTSLRKYNISIIMIILFGFVMITGVWLWYREKERQIEHDIKVRER